MQVRALLIYISIVVSLLCCSSLAISATNKQQIYIFHINGINTSPFEARANAQALKDVANIDSNFITWDFLYNETHGLLASDLWDVFRQKRQENKNLTIDDYVDTYMKAHHLSYPKGSKEYEDLKANIKNDYINDLGFVGKNFYDIHDQFHEKVGEMAENIHQLIK